MKVIKELPSSILQSIKLSVVSQNTLRNKKETIPVVISLTSIPSRLKTLHLVIKSIMAQTHLPHKIVLWLNESLENKIPSTLKRLESDLFHIKFSKLNCSHRKLIHSLALYPDATIITCDDDMIYRKEWLAMLYKEHQENPNCIIANDTVHINHNDQNQPLSFKKWKYPENELNINPKAIVGIGAFGILYPPNSLHHDVTRSDLFLKLTPKADDLWFKAMSILHGTLTTQANNIPRGPIPVIGSQKVALKKDNLKKDFNSHQWKLLSQHYDLPSIINKSS